MVLESSQIGSRDTCDGHASAPLNRGLLKRSAKQLEATPSVIHLRANTNMKTAAISADTRMSLRPDHAYSTMSASSVAACVCDKHPYMETSILESLAGRIADECRKRVVGEELGVPTARQGFVLVQILRLSLVDGVSCENTAWRGPIYM